MVPLIITLLQWEFVITTMGIFFSVRSWVYFIDRWYATVFNFCSDFSGERVLVRDVEHASEIGGFFL